MHTSARVAALTLMIAAVLVSLSSAAPNDSGPSYGPELQGFNYPFPVLHFRFTSQGESLDMAYMDVKPAKPNGHAVVLLHGKLFCASELPPRAISQRTAELRAR
jgi:hypothetical protein